MITEEIILPGVRIASGVSAMNLTLGGGVPGFATGESFSVAGRHGRDRNMLSLNGLPIAKLSHGERVSVGNDNGPRGGDIHVNVTAPNIGDPNRDRRTSMQQATDVSNAINRARARGF